MNSITEELHGPAERNAPSDSDRSTSNPEPTATPVSSEGSPASDRDDEHVCDFCGTDFDASFGRCPDCGAELIVRGTR